MFIIIGKCYSGLDKLLAWEAVNINTTSLSAEKNECSALNQTYTTLAQSSGALRKKWVY